MIFFRKSRLIFLRPKTGKYWPAVLFLMLQKNQYTPEMVKECYTKKIAINDSSGNTSFLLGISEDITEQKIARDNLAKAHAELDERVKQRTQELHSLNQELQQRLTQLGEAEARFRVAVESAPNAMIMISADGTIKLVNAETERIFGYQRQDLLGRDVEMLIPERYRAGPNHTQKGFFADLHGSAIGTGSEIYGLQKRIRISN